MLKLRLPEESYSYASLNENTGITENDIISAVKEEASSIIYFSVKKREKNKVHIGPEKSDNPLQAMKYYYFKTFLDYLENKDSGSIEQAKKIDWIWEYLFWDSVIHLSSTENIDEILEVFWKLKNIWFCFDTTHNEWKYILLQFDLKQRQIEFLENSGVLPSRMEKLQLLFYRLIEYTGLVK